MDAPSRDRWLAVNYAAAIFTSAFLLFQVQPLVSKHILPWFGGSSAVWTTCLLFFQTLLFFGYAYAHFIHAKLNIRQQVAVHLGLIVAAILFARVLPGESWEPRGGEEPVSSILLILAVSIGLPYFVLSGTGPLLQAWFARSFPGESPYRLYALSNVGSLLALLTYPFVFEPSFSVPAQARWWFLGFVIYGVLCAFAAWRLWKTSDAGAADRSGVSSIEHSRDSAAIAPQWWHRVLWLVLPMFASVVLMATTNHISTDIAVMPFLWVVPLALYLLTFIIAFDRPAWYRRTPLAVLVVIAVYLTAVVHHAGVGTAELFEIGLPGSLMSHIAFVFNPTASSPDFYISTLAFLTVNFATMFFICMVCHGELFRLRPDPSYLTSYYLMMSLGGALGGFFVTFVAPQIFETFFEWQLTLFIAAGFAILLVLHAMVELIFQEDNEHTRRPWHYLMLGGLVLAVFLPSAVMLLDLVDFLQPQGVEAQHRVRDFYGTLAVFERGDDTNPTQKHRIVKHGAITHGVQFTHESRRLEPLSYYAHNSGVGRTVDYYRSVLGSNPMRIGVVGLGAGTMAAYARKGDYCTFYEINPDMLEITESGRWFTFLKDARRRGAHCDIRLGDARLTLQRELDGNSSAVSNEGQGEGTAGNRWPGSVPPTGPQKFHVIVLDAFSGDSVPAHLLTVEAFELYLAHLTQASDPGGEGAILVHISNRYLNLAPLAFGTARHFGVHAIHIENEDDDKKMVYRSHWVVVTRNENLIGYLERFSSPIDHLPTLIWTDNHSSLLDVLK
jgi:hypothetical protein